VLAPEQQSSDPVGTLAYAAPEIFLNQSYAKSVDVWSLGNIFHCLLLGHLPFDHEDSSVLAKRVLQECIDFHSDIYRNISDEAKYLLSLMLNKDKNTRIRIQDVLKADWFTGLN